jgi:hypothetical protein
VLVHCQYLVYCWMNDVFDTSSVSSTRRDKDVCLYHVCTMCAVSFYRAGACCRVAFSDKIHSLVYRSSGRHGSFILREARARARRECPVPWQHAGRELTTNKDGRPRGECAAPWP